MEAMENPPLLPEETVTVSKRPDRVLLKQVCIPGDPYLVPYEDSRCKIELTDVLIKHEKGPRGIDPDSRIFSNNFDGTILIGDCDSFLDKDFELIIQQMCCGEICLATMIYNDSRGSVVKKVTCRIELIDVTEEQLISDWGLERLHETALHHKEEGVDLCSLGRIPDAFRRFNKSLKMLIATEPLNTATVSEEVVKDMMALKVKLYCNLAYCQMQFDEYTPALELANKALKLDPENSKALYRRCVAYEGLNMYEDAWKDIQHALTLEPNNRAVQQKALALKPKVEKMNQEYANVIKKMFA